MDVYTRSLGFRMSGTDKLIFRGLPDYPEWHSKLKGSFSLSLKEWRACQNIFQEKEMKTFADWLRYYKNLDVGPFIEALVKMRDFYTRHAIDIFKDAVSLPGVSMKFVLRGKFKGPDPPELYASGKEAYNMLKASVTGGPSILFTRYHKAGVTRIRSHQYLDGAPVDAFLATMQTLSLCHGKRCRVGGCGTGTK